MIFHLRNFALVIGALTAPGSASAISVTIDTTVNPTADGFGYSYVLTNNTTNEPVQSWQIPILSDAEAPIPGSISSPDFWNFSLDSAAASGWDYDPSSDPDSGFYGDVATAVTRPSLVLSYFIDPTILETANRNVLDANQRLQQSEDAINLLNNQLSSTERSLQILRQGDQVIRDQIDAVNQDISRAQDNLQVSINRQTELVGRIDAAEADLERARAAGDIDAITQIIANIQALQSQLSDNAALIAQEQELLSNLSAQLETLRTDLASFPSPGELQARIDELEAQIRQYQQDLALAEASLLAARTAVNAAEQDLADAENLGIGLGETLGDFSFLSLAGPNPGPVLVGLSDGNFPVASEIPLGDLSEIPLPATTWLFVSALAGLLGLGRGRPAS